MRKEVHFFAADHFPCTGPGDEGLNKTVIHDKEQYLNSSQERQERRLLAKLQPSTLAFLRQQSGLPKRFLMRNSHYLARASGAGLSAYMHLVRDGRETLGFAEGLSLEEERKQKGFEPMWWYKELVFIISRSSSYREVFGAQRVKVLIYEEFFSQS